MFRFPATRRRRFWCRQKTITWQALVYYAALKDAGAPVEMHLYAHDAMHSG
jgi:acetyl esterase/lipase